MQGLAQVCGGMAGFPGAVLFRYFLFNGLRLFVGTHGSGFQRFHACRAGPVGFGDTLDRDVRYFVGLCRLEWAWFGL